MALDVSVALIGAPEKNDTILIGLEDGRTLTLTYGTTIASKQWQILPLESLPEVNAVLEQDKDDLIAVVGDLECCVDSFETIAVGKHLRIQVSSRMPDQSKNVRTMLSSAVATITVV